MNVKEPGWASGLAGNLEEAFPGGQVEGWSDQ